MGSCCCKTGTVVVHPQRKSDASDDPLFADFHSDRGSESDSAGLVNQVGISTHDPSKLINGYENESSVSLEETLKPLQGQIPRLLMQIKDAKSKCHYPSEHHLTRDESAALYLYTMQRNDLDSLYHHLQRAWQSGRRSSLRPWFKYLKLLRSALDKLPNAKTEVWQGMVYDAEWAKTLQSNAVPLYTCMGTCSPSLSHLRDDLQRRSDDKLILIGYESIHGKDITGYSARHEKEVMMWPGIRLKKVEDKDSDSHISLILHFSGKSNSGRSAELSTRGVTPDLKHFACPLSACRNSCRGDHDARHCNGFSFLFRRVSHHCGARQSCFHCDTPLENLFECHMCRGRFCEKCCFK